MGTNTSDTNKGLLLSVIWAQRKLALGKNTQSNNLNFFGDNLGSYQRVLHQHAAYHITCTQKGGYLTSISIQFTLVLKFLKISYRIWQGKKYNPKTKRQKNTHKLKPLHKTGYYQCSKHLHIVIQPVVFHASPLYHKATIFFTIILRNAIKSPWEIDGDLDAT